jgi:alcohol dehydrogenase class IV
MYPIADYALTPNMAIVDANLVMNMPKGLAGGIDAVVHALEAYMSQCWRMSILMDKLSRHLNCSRNIFPVPILKVPKIL